MPNFVTASNKSRAAFALLLIVLLAVLFWTQSRYPALDDKALMSGAIQLEDPISFEAVLPVTADMPLWKRIAYSTINWLDTNKKGMLFGLMFGAAFLTFFSYLRRRSFQGGYSNSILGLIIGAPLGVCVNCAAPIAKGLYSSGVRAETALSAMIASPTMNVVVLTMAFSLLPFYMALTKIILSLMVILLMIPWICRLLPPEQLEVAQPIINDPPQPEGLAIERRDSILSALIAFIKSYLANLWFIVRTTVPLMFLAGLMGATAGALFPQDLILGASFSLWIVILVALIGTFLPVPIAFDVVVAGALLAGGLAQGYVFTLVFTLGTFSAYSFLIVARAISTRAAMLIGGVVAVLGILGGVGVNSYHNWQTDRALEQLLGSDFSLIGAAYAAGKTAPGTVEITRHPFAPRSPRGDAPFTRLEATLAGIDKPLEFSFKDMWPPFWEGRSLTTGDIDHDGDPDLVIASTERGLYIYLNDGHGQFTRAGDTPEPLAGLDVFNAALVDINNDGWPDLFITTYLTGNYIIPNLAGQFAFDRMQPVKNRPGAILSLALGFADIDRDGDLDVALGNWAAGWYRHIPGEESRNRILFNEGGTLTGDSYADLPGIPGETLSILFSDIDLDGATDLLVGNDFEVPDYIYMGDGTGGFKALTAQDAIIPHTTNTTMAIKTADLHNDGLPELYFAQIAGRSSGVSETLKMQALSAYCNAVTNAGARALCERNMQIKQWYKSGNRFDPTYAHKCNDLPDPLKDECRGMLVKDIAIQQNDPSICGLIPVPQTQARAYCDIHFMPPRPPQQSEIAAAIAQVKRSNVLLTRTGAAYEDKAEAEGLDVGGWSWDTKINDFDNDGFLDVYIVNGTWVPNEVSPSNLYFSNQGDGTFVEASGPMGLEDYLMTAAATVFDMDHDGDLDIITQPVNGPVIMFRNNAQTGNAIAFELRDQIGNSFGLGARITLRYGGKIQTREMQSGGGFMSFDAPVAFFGLADAEQIEGLTIHWADGSRTEISQSLKPGATYRVTRKN